QMLERTRQIFDGDLVCGRVQAHAARELLAEGAERGDQVGCERIAVARLDPRRHAPRQELGIALHIGEQRGHLLAPGSNETLITGPRQLWIKPRPVAPDARRAAAQNRRPPSTTSASRETTPP